MNNQKLSQKLLIRILNTMIAFPVITGLIKTYIYDPYLIHSQEPKN